MINETKTVNVSGPAFEDSDFQKKTPTLTFIRGDQVGRIVLLADDTIVLGRSPDATIMMMDTRVSRLHARIECDKRSRAYTIIDLGSSNGTSVNDKKIKEALLKEGDKIIIGRTVLRFSWIDAVDLAFHGDVEKLINIDDLTGLVVKRRFDEELDRHVAVARRTRSPLTMLMMDMDGLKTINDTHGHTCGAFAIAETGRIIKEVLASKGLASRFGGDEFVAFLPKISLEEAMKYAEEIRKRVEEHPYEKDGVQLDPTISIGIAALWEEDTPQSILERTDAAMYRSKRGGRNRITVSIEDI